MARSPIGYKIGFNGWWFKSIFGREACNKWCAQQLVAYPLLVIIYINNLDANLGGMIGKFADNTKVCTIVESEEGWLHLYINISVNV